MINIGKKTHTEEMRKEKKFGINRTGGSNLC